MYKAARTHLIFGLITLSIFSILTTEAAAQAGGAAVTAEDLNGQAIEQINNKKYDAAIGLLSKAIEIKPGLADAHFNLGTAHLLAGRAEVALGHIRKGTELNPSSYKGYNQLGVVYDSLRQDDLAIKALKKAIDLKPDYAFGHINLGKAYLFKNQLQLAREALEKGLRLDPSSDDGKLHLAVLYAKQARYSQAIKVARGVTERRPDDETANLILCQIYIMANDRDSALGLYQSFKGTNVSLADQMFRSLFNGRTVDASGLARP